MDGGHGWAKALVREIFTMPRQHVFVFLIATILLIIVEVELIEGWHLVHLLELVGAMFILYMGWVTYRAARTLNKREKL